MASTSPPETKPAASFPAEAETYISMEDYLRFFDDPRSTNLSHFKLNQIMEIHGYPKLFFHSEREIKEFLIKSVELFSPRRSTLSVGTFSAAAALSVEETDTDLSVEETDTDLTSLGWDNFWDMYPCLLNTQVLEVSTSEENNNRKDDEMESSVGDAITHDDDTGTDASPTKVDEMEGSVIIHDRTGTETKVSGAMALLSTIVPRVPTQLRNKRCLRRRSQRLVTRKLSPQPVSNSSVEVAFRKKKKREPPQRQCVHCLSEKSCYWRQGPDGKFTLCNACGLRYKKGKL